MSTSSLRTVYDGLLLLAELGLVHRPETGTGAIRDDTNLTTHAHVVCPADHELRDVAVERPTGLCAMLDIAPGAEKIDMSDADELIPYAVRTYRYLRLSIVVVVLSLMASVLIERLHVSCWQDSISAYYYTPVHAVFVGALVAIGVSLIAIKGSTDVEDMLLNVAGVLAPIVAFVPTSTPSGSCTSTAFIGGDTKAYIDNNVLAFAIGGGFAIAMAYVIARVMAKATIRRVDPPSLIGLVISVVLLVAGVVWYVAFRDTFVDNAHGAAAIAMFVIVGVVMIINARSARPRYRTLYALTAAAMALSAVAVILGKLVHSEWRHQILWLEILELLPFAVYWAAQTFEHWDGGVPTGAERAMRAAHSRIGHR